MVRGFFAAAALVIAAVPAQAQDYKTAVGGSPIELRRAWSTNPDCTGAGSVTMRLSGAPQHGRVTFTRGGVFPNFPASNVRAHCNTRRVPGITAHYTAQRGYSGPDSASIEIFFPDGSAVSRSFSISVR